MGGIQRHDMRWWWLVVEAAGGWSGDRGCLLANRPLTQPRHLWGTAGPQAAKLPMTARLDGPSLSHARHKLRPTVVRPRSTSRRDDVQLGPDNCCIIQVGDTQHPITRHHAVARAVVSEHDGPPDAFWNKYAPPFIALFRPATHGQVVGITSSGLNQHSDHSRLSRSGLGPPFSPCCRCSSPSSR